MARKSAALKEQPDLLGGAPQSAPAPKAQPIARAAPVQKSQAVAPLKRDPESILAIIARAAADKNVDPDKMQKLLDMQKDIMAEQAKRAFTAAFLKLQQHLPVIRPDGKIEIREKDSTGKRAGRMLQATPYATFPNIMKSIKPLLLENGFALSFAAEPSTDGTRLIVRGFLDHIDGHRRETAFPLPADIGGSKSNVQAWGSSQSYGKRYCTVALLNIVSNAKEDRDTDGVVVEAEAQAEQQIETLDDEQIKKLRSAVEFCGVGLDKFCKHWQIEKLEQLPAADFEDAMKACKTYAEKHGR